MSQLTWRYELAHHRASAVSDLGTYRIQGGAGQRWVALFIPLASIDTNSLSDVFTACNFATLQQAIQACVEHAGRCVRI